MIISEIKPQPLNPSKAGRTGCLGWHNPGHWCRLNLPSVTSGMIKKKKLNTDVLERIWGFIFNTRRPPFDNDKVRRALSLMIDYDWINRNIFHDQQSHHQLLSKLGTCCNRTPWSRRIGGSQPVKPTFLPKSLAQHGKPPSGSMVANRANQINADTLLKPRAGLSATAFCVNEQTGEPFSFEILPAWQKMKSWQSRSKKSWNGLNYRDLRAHWRGSVSRSPHQLRLWYDSAFLAEHLVPGTEHLYCM